jgi:hypothetical protein
MRTRNRPAPPGGKTPPSAGRKRLKKRNLARRPLDQAARDGYWPGALLRAEVFWSLSECGRSHNSRSTVIRYLPYVIRQIPRGLWKYAGMKPRKSVLYSAQETLQAPIFVVSPAETSFGLYTKGEP